MMRHGFDSRRGTQKFSEIKPENKLFIIYIQTYKHLHLVR